MEEYVLLWTKYQKKCWWTKIIHHKITYNLVTQILLINVVDSKTLGFIAYNTIYETCLWNEYKALIVLLLFSNQYYLKKYLKRKNFPIINSSNKSAQSDLFGQIQVLVEFIGIWAYFLDSEFLGGFWLILVV